MNNEELNRLRALAGTAKATPKPEYTAPKTVQQIMEQYVPVEEAYGDDEEDDRRAFAKADREPKKKVSVKKAPWDKEIDESDEEERTRRNALAGLDNTPYKKVTVKKAPWDDELEEADEGQDYVWYDTMSLPDNSKLFDKLDDLLGHDPVQHQGPRPEDSGRPETHVAVPISNKRAIAFLNRYKAERVDDAIGEASDEDNEISRMSALAGLDKEPKKKVSVKKAPWDKEIDEAGAPDYNPAAGRYNRDRDSQAYVWYDLRSWPDDQDLFAELDGLLGDDYRTDGNSPVPADFERSETQVGVPMSNRRAIAFLDQRGAQIVDEAIDEASDEDNEISRMSALAGLDKEPKKKVSVKKAPWDDELEEGAKPDFADIDDDGDKDETAKKAADDKEAMSEQQQMREWSNSVYKQYEDRGHVMDQPEGETVDLSLRRYLNAEPLKVSIEEDVTAESLAEAYKKFKK